MLLAAAALAAYFFWSQRARFGLNSTPGENVSAADEAGLLNDGTQPGSYAPGSSSGSAGSSYGTAANPTQAQIDANRVPNEAGLPSNGKPIPSAPIIPVKAAQGEIIGYRVDKNGVSQPLRAGDAVVPNSPGTFAVVDPFADGGYAVVPATKPGPRLSQAELERLRARERASERRGN